MSQKIVRDKAFLHRPCSPVDSIQEGEAIAAKLFSTLNEYPFGIGLSANQIGILKRVSIIVVPESEPLILINPEITELSPEKVYYNEGCLSLPGKIVPTVRHLRVSISTLNHANVLTFGPDVDPVTSESIPTDYGLLKSVCIQHEIGHLNGQLITDDDVRVKQIATTTVKYGRNEKVVIEKDGETRYLKYKVALPMIENDGWRLI